MAKIKESTFDQNYRRVLTILKRVLKLWFFVGILFTAIFHLKNTDMVKNNVPKTMQESLWGWYEDIKKTK